MDTLQIDADLLLLVEGHGLLVASFSEDFSRSEQVVAVPVFRKQVENVLRLQRQVRLVQNDSGDLLAEFLGLSCRESGPFTLNGWMRSTAMRT